MKYMSRIDAIEHLISKISINKETGCWNYPTSSGIKYGEIRITGFLGNPRRIYRAHRLSYELFIGDIPEGMFVCHKCDIRSCCNPNHLFVGTHKDNMRDMAKKGRAKGRKAFGNKYRAKRVKADGVIYDSYVDAGKALGISDNGVRKRVRKGLDGYGVID